MGNCVNLPNRNFSKTRIGFTRPFLTGNELLYIEEAVKNLNLAGNGPFTKRCQSWLETKFGCGKAFLTSSGTDALEMAAILTGVEPGDEVIMPSFTFVSTANAFVLRGAVPVFIDIRPDMLGIDEELIEAAITPKTKAVVPVHYAGVGCEMDKIMAIAVANGLIVVEDAAHCVEASYGGRQLGSIGHLAALSFHDTKNIVAGESGALLVNDARFIERAAVIWEKGTNRQAFFLGQVDKYTWTDIGSSFMPGEILAAFLWAQMEQATAITESRLKIWHQYHERFEEMENLGFIRRPVIPANRSHNAHIYYLIVQDSRTRAQLLSHLDSVDVGAVFHYVPLHQSPAGARFARTCGSLTNTEEISSRLIRLPLWPELTEDQIDRVVQQVSAFFKHNLVTAKSYDEARCD
jgi:dTDP-4-amino-4,6-dideoxygalactose transaminase